MIEPNCTDNCGRSEQCHSCIIKATLWSTTHFLLGWNGGATVTSITLKLRPCRRDCSHLSTYASMALPLWPKLQCHPHYMPPKYQNPIYWHLCASFCRKFFFLEFKPGVFIAAVSACVGTCENRANWHLRYALRRHRTSFWCPHCTYCLKLEKIQPRNPRQRLTLA